MEVIYLTKTGIDVTSDYINEINDNGEYIWQKPPNSRFFTDEDVEEYE